MRNNTRLLYTALLAQIASLNGVANAAEKFSVDPSVQQTLETRLQESSAFLQRINIVGVNDQKGEKLGIGVGNPIASTTNTSTTDREPREVHDLVSNEYECTQTNYDTAIKYATLDAWAKFKDFQTRVRDLVLRRQALDRIMIGFNGTSRAATSNLTANPMLQDVNKGWLQHYREQAPERVMAEVVEDSSAIKIGATGDYKNLDALVMDAIASLIDPWYQNDTGLVAVLGRDLLHDKYFPLVNTTQAPTEQLAADLVISQKRVGGVGAVTAPFVPAGKILITRLDNLSIYFQDSARRRALIDNPKRDRIENYESSNDAFVVEDFGAGCLLENIQFV